MADKEMSEWIKFFTGAGIPPGAASTYSLSFIDNRIKRNMLLDLTKEYLKEMGISVMGDVIAILKYARSTHLKEEREMPALSALPATQDGKIEIKRQTTAGNRMLEHYMRKEGMISSEPEAKVKVTTEMAARLGAVPKRGSKSTLDISRVKQVEVIPVKKARKVTPDPEQKSTVSNSKKSVFDRLGGENQSSTLTTPSKIAPSTSNNGGVASKRSGKDTHVTVISLKNTESDSSVFRRLGGMKRQETMSMSSDDGSELDYHGVLKAEALQLKRMKKIMKPVVAAQSNKSNSVAEKKSALQRLGPQQTGVTVRLGPAKTNVSARLGPLKSEATSTSTSSSGSGVKITRTVSNISSLQERLGVQKAEASSTSDICPVKVTTRNSASTTKTMVSTNLKVKIPKITIKKGAGIVKRLGTQTKSVPITQTTRKTGLIARLGTKEKKLVKTLSKGKNTGAVLERLGLPITKEETGTITSILAPTRSKTSSIMTRLGTQKVVPTSTTSSKKGSYTKIVKVTTSTTDKSARKATIGTTNKSIAIVSKSPIGKVSSTAGVFSRLGSK